MCPSLVQLSSVSVTSVAVVCVTTTAIPGDNTNGGSPVGIANANDYTDNGVLSQYLQLPGDSVGNEIWSSRVLAHIP